jgi:hypothetical protein
VASGIAEDLDDYATKLADNRAIHEGEEGDLDGEEAAGAWEAIAELCRLKGIVPPAALRRALGLPESAPPSSRPPTHASGEIVSSSPMRSGEIVAGMLGEPAAAARSPKLEEALRAPSTRLRAATEALQGRSRLGDVEAVIDALEDFETDELLAILPDLSDLGPRVVPGLIAKLRSERREVRQAAVILLGMAVDPQALDHLASLEGVRASGAQIRGEIPLSENTEIRGFSRRAYEAIMVPELEVEAEA